MSSINNTAPSTVEMCVLASKAELKAELSKLGQLLDVARFVVPYMSFGADYRLSAFADWREIAAAASYAAGNEVYFVAMVGQEPTMAFEVEPTQKGDHLLKVVKVWGEDRKAAFGAFLKAANDRGLMGFSAPTREKVSSEMLSDIWTDMVQMSSKDTSQVMARLTASSCVYASGESRVVIDMGELAAQLGELAWGDFQEEERLAALLGVERRKADLAEKFKAAQAAALEAIAEAERLEQELEALTPTEKVEVLDPVSSALAPNFYAEAEEAALA
jgi:hypothetical protein